MKVTVLTASRGITIVLFSFQGTCPYFTLPRVMKEGYDHCSGSPDLVPEYQLFGSTIFGFESVDRPLSQSVPLDHSAAGWYS